MPAAARAVPVAEPKLDNRQLLAALRAFRRGDFSVRLPRDLTGPDGEIAEAFNDVAENNERVVRDITRVATLVGRQGERTTRADLRGLSGGWRVGCVA